VRTTFDKAGDSAGDAPYRYSSKGVAAEIADQRKVFHWTPPATTSCSGCLRWSACGGHSGGPGPCGRRSWSARHAAIAPQRNGFVDGQPAGHAGGPHQLAVTLGISVRCTNWCTRCSSCRHSSTPRRAPVISSSCDSLKSVVMWVGQCRTQRGGVRRQCQPRSTAHASLLSQCHGGFPPGVGHQEAKRRLRYGSCWLVSVHSTAGPNLACRAMGRR
jgi:hypothetical protein